MAEYCKSMDGKGNFHCLQTFDPDLASKVIRDERIRNEIQERTFMQMTHEQMAKIDREKAELAAKNYEMLREKKADIDFASKSRF